MWGLCVLLLVAAFACQSDDVPQSSGDEPAAATDLVTLPRHHDPPVINSGEEYVFGEILRAGPCLRVSYIDQSYPELARLGLLVVWPPGVRAHVHDDVVQVVDPAGTVLAKTGDTVRFSGRKVSEDSGQAPQLDWDGVPAAECPGPYWLVGDEVSAGVSQYSSADPDAGIFFPTLGHQRGAIVSMLALLEGRLELQGECLLVVPAWGPQGFVIVWPPGFRVAKRDGEMAVVNGGGSLITRVGDEVAVGGGQPPSAVFPEDSRYPGEGWHAMSVRSVP